MDKSIECECGNTLFWFFGSFFRCNKCYNEFKNQGDELWMRRFNLETHEYCKNWEHFKI